MKYHLLLLLCTLIFSACKSTNTTENPISHSRIFSIMDLDQPPSYKKTIPPVHPEELKKDFVEGSATVECVINTKGRVAEIRETKASHPLFAIAAEECVRQWTFYPGKVSGKKVNFLVRIPIKFQLK